MSHQVLVLAGGLSHERDVSLRSGRRVAQALRESGHTVEEADVTPALLARLASDDRPVVFPVLHGGVGEDGALREVLDLLGVGYVGSTGRASRMAFDKAVSTPLVAAAGVATPREYALPQDMFRELGASALVDALASGIGFPMMVKPSRSGSALGCSRVDSAADLPSAIVTAFGYGDVAIVEEYIDGREMAVSAHRALGLRDLSRTDLIVRDGKPVFIEVNVAPGMTETSLVPLAIEASGSSFAEVCSALVAAAAARVSSAPRVTSEDAGGSSES